MKTLKDEILEILLDKIKCSGYTAIEGMPQSAREIESLIKENYVEKEFVRWFAEQDEFYHCIIDDEEKWYIPDWSTNILPRYLSFDELYDHWKREVKSKQEIK